MFQKRKLNFANLLLVVKRDEERKQLRWRFILWRNRWWLSSPHTRQGVFQISQWAEVGPPLQLQFHFYRLCFTLLYLVAQTGQRMVALRRRWLGILSEPAAVLIYSRPCLLYSKCPFPLWSPAGTLGREA